MLYWFPDEALLAGTLTWRQTSFEHGRTAAIFSLTLALSRQYYVNASIGDEVVMPGSLQFGDETQANALMMEV